jgi:type IV pilus assembly protein PilC
MPQFVYVGRDQAGKKVKGKVEAKTKEIAATILRQKGFFIVSVTDSSESVFNELQAAMSKVKKDDVVNFTRQLATMINAGLPMIQAFSILESQAKPAMKKVVKRLQRDIEGGSNLGDALAKQGDVFDTVYIALVKAGEAAGALDTILNRLADTLEKQKEFRAKTKGALIYPGIVFTAMIVVMLIMMIFVVPKMTDLYSDFDAELPAATQFLMDFSAFLRNQWYVLGGAIFLGWFLLRSWRKTAQGHYEWDKLMLRVPVFGTLRQKILVTEFSRTLSLMISAGISLLQALDIVKEGLDNEVYRQAVLQAKSDVEKGKQLSKSLERQALFPLLLPQMVLVGEETGQLDDVLTKLAKYYESETETAIKGLTTAIEPMIMVVLGLGVGFLIIAIVMPIYNLTSQF